MLFKAGTLPRTLTDPLRWEWRERRGLLMAALGASIVLNPGRGCVGIHLRARRGRFHSFHTMVRIDNHAILAVVTKGRSSSKVVNPLLRGLAALRCS